MIYCIQAGDGGPVKIGTADDVAARLVMLQTGNHLPLTVIREIPGGMVEEKWLHHHFRAQRLRGEWFAFHAEMLTIEPAAPTPQPRPNDHPFVSEIEAFLAHSGLAATSFGRLAMDDPAFVFKLRKGRSPSLRTVDRVRSFMAAAA